MKTEGDRLDSSDIGIFETILASPELCMSALKDMVTQGDWV